MQSIIRPVLVKSFIGCLVLGLTFTSAPAGALKAAGIVNFTIFLRNDMVLDLDSREKRLNIEKSAFDIVVYEKQGSVYENQDEAFQQAGKITWPEITRNIYSIDLINSNRAIYAKAKLLLTRHDGTQSVIQYGSLHTTDGSPLDAFHYSEFNRVASRWTRQEIPVESVKRLVLGTTRLMINFRTGKLFPPDYRYDPYTGETLSESPINEN